MTTPILLNDCLSLIDLMLMGEDHGPSFQCDGAQCSVEKIKEHARFEAVTDDFGFKVITPVGNVGDHREPAYITIIGEVHECLRWLPMDREDKRTLIARLPLSAADQALCELMI